MVKWLAKIIIFCKLLYIFYVDEWATELERLPRLIWSKWPVCHKATVLALTSVSFHPLYYRAHQQLQYV